MTVTPDRSKLPAWQLTNKSRGIRPSREEAAVAPDYRQALVPVHMPTHRKVKPGQRCGVLCILGNHENESYCVRLCEGERDTDDEYGLRIWGAYTKRDSAEDAAERRGIVIVFIETYRVKRQEEKGKIICPDTSGFMPGGSLLTNGAGTPKIKPDASQIGFYDRVMALKNKKG